MERKQPTSFRLSAEALERLLWLSQRLGISQAAVGFAAVQGLRAAENSMIRVGDLPESSVHGHTVAAVARLAADLTAICGYLSLSLAWTINWRKRSST